MILANEWLLLGLRVSPGGHAEGWSTCNELPFHQAPVHERCEQVLQLGCCLHELTDLAVGRVRSEVPALRTTLDLQIRLRTALGPLKDLRGDRG